MSEENEYERPLRRHLVLWALFAVLLVVGTISVLVPALEDHSGEEEAPRETNENADDDETAAPSATP